MTIRVLMKRYMKGVNKMTKAAFIGFGEVNTPKELIIEKCRKAEDSLLKEGIELISIYPVTDDYERSDVNKAIESLVSQSFQTVILCIAGWIPSHAVISITERFKDTPMVLWGLSGWMEKDRIVTTADQAATSAIRKVMSDLGYKFKFVYEIVGKPLNSKKIADFCKASDSMFKLKSSRAGMMGYRDMNLYGTMFDGVKLKRHIGTDIECFEMLEVEQRAVSISKTRIQEVIHNEIEKWKFLKSCDSVTKEKAARYYLAISDICKERGYEAVSLKDVDGMKKLLSYPPAPIFMLLSDIDKLCTIPENDSYGMVTQLMVKYLTGQCGAYLEFYEFMEDCVLAGVPDYIPKEITQGDTVVMPAAFGQLSEGILNVSSVKPGNVILYRLSQNKEGYCMHIVKGRAETADKWEEAGWTQPAPQLPGLMIYLDDVETFAMNVMSQHYIIAYEDNADKMVDLCKLLNIEVVR